MFGRSDLGPKIGYEAVGLIDSNLKSVGVWAHSQKGEVCTIPHANIGTLCRCAE